MDKTADIRIGFFKFLHLLFRLFHIREVKGEIRIFASDGNNLPVFFLDLLNDFFSKPMTVKGYHDFLALKICF